MLPPFTKVVKANPRKPNFTLYIGRAWAGLSESKWKNTHFISEWQPRAHVLSLYEQDIRSNPELMASLHEIDNQTLGCWCHKTCGDEPLTDLNHPEACHGDVLVKLRREQLGNS